ncbi:uncharacterized protein LOC143372179 isoform X2 [Andrena cerasifolii]|uniref:uncharacterized protein LOC143372179 isoform X2 n=1 Tax=Andrena cerasifolii TaxID=2819439 RepID=UPI0040379F80
MNKKSGIGTSIAGPSSAITSRIKSDSSNDSGLLSDPPRKRHRKQKEVHKQESSMRNLEPSAKVAEIRLCIDIIEHSKFFKPLTHFSKNIAKSMPLTRGKITAIIENVVNKYLISETIEILQGKYFSVLIHETSVNTEKCNTKILCLLIRYVHEKQICIHLLDIIRIKECSPENVYKCFLHSLKKNDLSVNNMIGVCVDNANAMLGKQNSLISHLLRDNKEMSVFPCICYSMYLVACRASDHLPLQIQQLFTFIYTCLTVSEKQQNVLEDLQDFMDDERETILQLSLIRWVALPETVERILSQWTDLFAVFEKAAAELKCSERPKQIYRILCCPYTKAYLQFLNYALNIFTRFNTVFQSSEVLVHCLLPECFRLLRSLGGNFIKREYIVAPNLHEIDVYNEGNLLPLQSIFIGEESVATINEIRSSNSENSQGIIDFYENIRKYYQSAFIHTVRRLPFNEKFLNSLKFLSPRVALDARHQKDQLNCVLSKFKSKLNFVGVVNEWHLMPLYFSREEKQTLQVLSITQFWDKIRNITDFSGKYVFENVTKVAQLCLSLPHSNADVERFLYTISEITNESNVLKPKTIAALGRIKLDLYNKNASSSNYIITDKMLDLFNNNMYKKESIPKEFVGILLSDETDESDSENS